MNWSLNIASETKNIDQLREFLHRIFVCCEFDFSNFNRVFLGVSEAVCNGIVHGNKSLSDKSVHIYANCDSGRLVVSVTDEGMGFDFNAVEDPTLEVNLRKSSGRGIFIMKNMADEVSYLEGGRKVSIKFVFKR